ncbi:Hypothetical predicted protein [Podarcis lilfordi]|uniref:Uncharacterized protein n=1 Tax=Podarcis lilfordi TaxID=74358 RepID=A0AA35JMI4_9SAUR|nr:Hypothetical predicted protein [Podarcis lilfordi]
MVSRRGARRKRTWLEWIGDFISHGAPRLVSLDHSSHEARRERSGALPDGSCSQEGEALRGLLGCRRSLGNDEIRRGRFPGTEFALGFVGKKKHGLHWTERLSDSLGEEGRGWINSIWGKGEDVDVGVWGGSFGRGRERERRGAEGVGAVRRGLEHWGGAPFCE